MKFGPLPTALAEGAVLAHSQVLPDRRLGKGHVLNAADVADLADAGIDAVIAVRFEPEDVPEDTAAAALAEAIAGPGLRIEAPFTGRVNLFAETDGVFTADRAAIDRLNGLHEAITIATVPAFDELTAGRMAATIKIIPFAAPRDALDAALAVAHAAREPVLRLRPYRPLRVHLIQTELPSVAAKTLDKTVRITAERIEAVGGTLAGESRCAHDEAALAAAIDRAHGADIDLLLVAGASAITDRRDVLPAGIEAAGGVVHHFGMPVDPGNLLLLAERDGRPVLGLPGCARSPKLNGFDWVLQRLAAGIPVGRADIMAMGVGGLLTEIPTRPQPRRGKPEPKPSRPRIAALVLAAGRSSRMGADNKLLMPVDGKPMVAHAVDAALASRADMVLVVTGHQAEAVEAALAGREARFVRSPDYADGLSRSLIAGLEALPDDADGVLVCLGDMPRIAAEAIDRLIEAFAPDQGRAIVLPSVGGRRGNPVLWDRRFIDEMKGLVGDEGARALLARHADQVHTVAMEDDAALLDVDTPEAMAALLQDARP
ncbi:NTP transferase domain-containing protein [Marinivivus vitaminiproducens]|uniref:NTP transferase domain-containing protein n=1 Tax=Marinivivus vitaminiproducens TaxID=3035935 RepID=UPI00279AFE6F|nr:molybdopterin-binding/glycosyltransferase family 2 protein [Geminicoccaceae bacterium SCSIO 64248]